MLLSSLPAPTREHARPEQPEQPASRVLNVGTAAKEPPPYGSAERRQYRPRRQEDFGDGGPPLISLLRPTQEGLPASRAHA